MLIRTVNADVEERDERRERAGHQEEEGGRGERGGEGGETRGLHPSGLQANAEEVLKEELEEDRGKEKRSSFEEQGRWICALTLLLHARPSSSTCAWGRPRSSDGRRMEHQSIAGSERTKRSSTPSGSRA